MRGMGLGLGVKLPFGGRAGGGGFDPASLPGPLALWKMDEGAGLFAKNAFAPSPNPGTNIFPFPEQLGRIFNAGVTDNYADNPDGTHTASRVQLGAGANDTSAGFIGGATAATYTLSVYAKSNTGTDQTFRFRAQGFAYSPVQTVAAAGGWQRFSFSFVASAAVPVILSTDGTNAFDILFWGVQLEAGPSATAYRRMALDLSLNTGSAPTWEPTGLYAADGNRWGVAIRDGRWTGAAVTWYHVGKQDPAGPGWWLTDLAGYGAARAGTGDGAFGGATLSQVGIDAADGEWHIHELVGDAAGLHLYCDGTLVVETAAAPSAADSYGVLLGYLGAGFGFAGSTGAAAMYSAAHTPEQRAQMRAHLTGLMAGRGVSIPGLDVFVAFEGDSLTRGLGAAGDEASYPNVAMAANPTVRQFVNLGVGGSTVPALAGRADRLDLRLVPAKSRTVLCVLLGANDLNPTDDPDGSVFVARLKAYCLARRAAGWHRIVIGTVLPTTRFAGGFNTIRNLVNPVLRADPSFYDGLMDFAADPDIGTDSAAADGAKYGDGVHPTTPTYARMGAIAAPAIAAALGA